MLHYTPLKLLRNIFHSVDPIWGYFSRCCHMTSLDPDYLCLSLWRLESRCAFLTPCSFLCILLDYKGKSTWVLFRHWAIVRYSLCCRNALIGLFYLKYDILLPWIDHLIFVRILCRCIDNHFIFLWLFAIVSGSSFFIIVSVSREKLDVLGAFWPDTRRRLGDRDCRNLLRIDKVLMADSYGFIADFFANGINKSISSSNGSHVTLLCALPAWCFLVECRSSCISFNSIIWSCCKSAATQLFKSV